MIRHGLGLRTVLLISLIVITLTAASPRRAIAPSRASCATPPVTCPQPTDSLMVFSGVSRCDVTAAGVEWVTCEYIFAR